MKEFNNPLEISARNYPVLGKEEVKSIAQLPKQERVLAVAKARERILEFRKVLAKFEINMYQKLDDSKSVDWEEIKKDASEFMDEENLPPPIRQEILSVLGKLESRKSLIEEVVKNYPAADEIYARAFGQKPRGKVEILVNSASLMFACSNPDDYALIASNAFLDYRAPTDEEKNWAKRTGGVRIGRCLIPGLAYAITASNQPMDFHKNSGCAQPEENTRGVYRISLDPNSSAKYWYGAGTRIATHEIQHAIHALFRKFDQQEKSLAYYTGRNLVEKAAALLCILREDRRLAEFRMKDEILAYLKEGRMSNEITEILSGKEEKGGLYDYEGQARKRLEMETSDWPRLIRKFTKKAGGDQKINGGDDELEDYDLPYLPFRESHHHVLRKSA